MFSFTRLYAGGCAVASTGIYLFNPSRIFSLGRAFAVGVEEMNTVELGQYWLRQLTVVLPQSSTRIRTRLAWHLARLNIRSDEKFAALKDAALTSSSGKTEQFLKIRAQYMRSLTDPVRLQIDVAGTTDRFHDHPAGLIDSIRDFRT